MKNSFKILIVGVIVLLIIGSLLLLSQSNQDTSPQTHPNTTNIPPLSSANLETVPTDESYVISTPQGDVVVKNFFKASDSVKSTRVDLHTDFDYSLVYSPSAQKFYITTSAYDMPDFNKTRTIIENFLLENLTSTKSDLCKLNLTIETTDSPDESVSNQTFPLSFCAQ